MIKCVDCGSQISTEQGHLCESCYKERLKKAIENESHMPKRAEVSE